MKTMSRARKLAWMERCKTSGLARFSLGNPGELCAIGELFMLSVEQNEGIVELIKLTAPVGGATHIFDSHRGWISAAELMGVPNPRALANINDSIEDVELRRQAVIRYIEGIGVDD